jgi:outer membrane immunogenic protein
MKKFLLSTVAIAMLSTAASAADLDMAPEPILDNWAGWYAGINGGYGFANDPGVGHRGNNDLVDDFLFDALNLGGRRDPDATGFFGGGQVGYNWQDDIYVYGLEGDFQFSNIKASDNNFTCLECERDGPDYFHRLGFGAKARQKLKWFSTVRGRVGISPNESLLFYTTAGLAFGKVKSGADIYVFEEEGVPNDFDSYLTSFAGSSSKTKVGWTIGIGSELKITENTSFKFEYLYLDLGKTSGRGDLFFEECDNGGCESGFESDYNVKHKFKHQFHTVKAGFNWGF